jgi:hypothetical protein
VSCLRHLFLKYVYKPRFGFDSEDVVALPPILAGTLFLVAAAFALDWFVDSMAPFELLALNRTHSALEHDDHQVFSDARKGFAVRARLMNGAYFLFALCVSAILFLLGSCIPIFLNDAIASPSVRLAVITIAFAYCCLLLLKMMTTSISKGTWRVILVATGVASAIYAVLTATLLRVF